MTRYSEDELQALMTTLESELVERKESLEAGAPESFLIPAGPLVPRSHALFTAPSTW